MEKQEHPKERLSIMVSEDNAKFIKKVRSCMDEHRKCNHSVTDAVDHIIDCCSRKKDWKKVLEYDDKA